MKKGVLFLSLMIGSMSFAQNNPFPGDMHFRNIGPAGMSGRVTTIDADLHHPGTFFIGSASGGLWKTINSGQTWTPIFDQQPTSSIGAVTIAPNNPDVIWVGTGEGNPRNSQSSGYGIYKSIDGGRTWKCMGLENTRNIHRIIVHPTNPDILWVAAIGVAWGEGPDRGVYKSVDGGKTWQKTLFVNDQTGAADLIIDPLNPNKLFCAMWDYRRMPWQLRSGGPGSGLYITLDGGTTWEKRTSKDGLPEGDLGRIGLAVAPSNSKIVYALVENKDKNALYSSEDGGFKWNRISDDSQIGNRPFYYSDIYVDPKNPKRLFSLWTNITVSEDGGKNWSTAASSSSVHSDHHAFWIHPDNPDFIIEGNDGGLNFSYDGGKTWTFTDNLPLAQFYHIAVDNAFPYHVYGGMQDNGSWKGPAYTFTSTGIRNGDWNMLFYGDGFDVGVHATDPNIIYAMAQEGHVVRVNEKAGHYSFIRPVEPKGGQLRFNWNAAFALDPFHPDALYYGSEYVHYSKNQGSDWTIISPDLTTNNPDRQKALESGGLTFDVTGAENYTTILCITPSPLDSNLIYVGTDDGKVQMTNNRGKTWTDVTSKIKGLPKDAWIPQIRVSQTNPDEVFVIANNYRMNDWNPYAFHSTDRGKSWKRIADEKNVSGHCLSILQDSENPDLIFLGTEHGLYYSIDHAKTWTKWDKSLPTMPVQDLALQEREGDLVLGTFGRAAWVLDDIRPLRAMAESKGKVLQSNLFAFDAPTAYQTGTAAPRGYYFPSNSYFQGENRPMGANLSYWVMEADSTKKEKEKVQIDVYDQSGQHIRHLERDYQKGLNRWTWDMEMKGPRFPRMNVPDIKRKNDPGFGSVLPGDYWVVYQFENKSDTTVLKVETDPRYPVDPSALKERLNAYQAIAPYFQAADELAIAMAKCKSGIELVEAQLKGLESDSSYNPLRKSIKATKDSLEALRLDFFGKENVKGYYEQPEIWTSKCSRVLMYLGSQVETPSTSSKVLIQNVKEETDKILMKGNRFLQNDWSKFVSDVEKMAPGPMKPASPIQIKQE